MSDLNVSHTRSPDNKLLEITLTGRLAIDTAAELAEFLHAQLPSAAKIRLDLSALAEIDLVGVQLICSACRTAMTSDLSLNFTGTLAPCVQEAIGTVGLQRHSTCKHKPDQPCIWCGGIN